MRWGFQEENEERIIQAFTREEGMLEEKKDGNTL